MNPERMRQIEELYIKASALAQEQRGEFLAKACAGDNSLRSEVEELLSYVLKLPRIELYMQFDRPMIEQELIALREAIKRRAEGEPSQYIAGYV